MGISKNQSKSEPIVLNRHGKSSDSFAGPLSEILPVPELVKNFPTTRYYGSKRKLLNWLYRHLGPLPFDNVLDAFGGTASVSLLFKAMRKDVTYHDGFSFNEDVARTLLSDKVLLEREDVERFCRNVKLTEGVVFRNFDGVFYLKDENAWIDGFLISLKNGDFSEREKALLRFLLYQSCLKKRPFNLFHRANLNLRVNSDIDRSFGNAVTWSKSFTTHILTAFDELSKLCPQAQGKASILPSGDVSKIKKDYDLIYLDPPYISKNAARNRDGYWKRYHFLEGLSKYETWEANMDLASPIKSLHQPTWFKEWSHKETFPEKLFELIRECRSSITVLSYVTDAHPTFEQIKDVFINNFREVSIHTVDHHHALSKKKRRELLFIGRP
ncbi:MAG: DNA adenine methylase [Pseudomonadota bacterium]